MNTEKSKDSIRLDSFNTESLLAEVQKRLLEAQKNAALAQRAESFSPIEEAGPRIRAERKKQGLTLHDLCDLSGVAYATLNKIEHGHGSARMDNVNSIVRALGMRLWIG